MFLFTVFPPLDSEGFQKNIKNIYEKPKKIYNGAFELQNEAIKKITLPPLVLSYG